MGRAQYQLAEPLRSLLRHQALEIERHLARGGRQSGSITCPCCYRPARWKKQGNARVEASCSGCGFEASAELVPVVKD